MRLFLLSLAITLASSFSPVLAAPGDIFIVFRPDAQGRYPSQSGERWSELPPEPGKNIPANSLVLKLILEQGDENPWHYKRTGTGLVYDPPKKEEPVIAPENTEQKISRAVKEKAADSKLSDAEWLKLFRASKSEDLQKKEEVLQEMDSKKLDGG